MRTENDMLAMLKEKQAAAEEILKTYLPSADGLHNVAAEAANYSAMAGGKRLRPILMAEFAGLSGRLPENLPPFMAAIEMIHTSSLIHDDLPCMDNDTLRRGMPTAWAKFGEDMAVLAGDLLMIHAFETAALAADMPGADAGTVAKAMGLLAAKTGNAGMIGGQVADVYLTGKPVTETELKYIYEKKTGALIEASMMIGAMLGGADEGQTEAAGKIAADIGLAFQITDDMLDVAGDEKKLGKPIKSDEKNSKTTYVTLYGMEAAGARVRELTAEAKTLLNAFPGDHTFLLWLFDRLTERES